MKNSYRKIQRNVFTAEFKKFCNKELSKYMLELEKIRLFYSNTIIVLIVLMIASVVIVYHPFKIYDEPVKMQFLIAFNIALGYSIYVLFQKYKVKAKNMMLEKLLSYIGDFKKSSELGLFSYVKTLSLFDKFNRYDCDDRIQGTYNLLKVDIAEINLALETGRGKHRRVKPVFKGLLVIIPCLKKFKGKTIIKRNSINIGFNSSKVNLEDPEFEKLYDVYSTDQIEARYLITTAFMNRMVQLARKGIGENITLSFELGKVNIAVASLKNWFEFPLFKKATKIENYRAIILEIITILKIIDSLKLDKNIGL